MSEPRIFTPNGRVAPIASSWEPPSGQSKYFGWMTPHGPIAVKIDEIKVCAPQVGQDGNSNGTYVLLVANANIPIPATDALRLMKIAGWKERTGVEGVVD